jgi:hypothetical protein
MAIFNFIKTAKNQKFHIETRYYDPVKEEVLKRVKDLEDMQGSDTESIKKRMAYKMKRRGDHELKRKIRQKQMRKYFMRMLVLLIVLLLITYLLLVKYLPKLTEILEKSSSLN